MGLKSPNDLKTMVCVARTIICIVLYCFKNHSPNQQLLPHLVPGGGVLYIFWIRGRSIGKDIDFHNFGIRNGIKFRILHNWYRVGYAFSENWYKVGYIFLKNWYKDGYTFWKNWHKERVCF